MLNRACCRLEEKKTERKKTRKKQTEEEVEAVEKRFFPRRGPRHLVQ